MADQGPRALTIAGREEESYCVLPGRADRGLILLCDHAGNAMPAGVWHAGAAGSDSCERHIAYDIGVAPIVRALAAALDAPAVMTRYSRLLIDPNRGRDDPTLIMRLSDGAVIPGNRKLDAAEREKRMRLYYEPYHRAIDAVIDQCLATGVAARAAFDPLLHGELEGVHPALARRRAVERRCAAGQAPAGRLLCRRRPDRRRQRALCRPARRRLPVAARRAARALPTPSSRSGRI